MEREKKIRRPRIGEGSGAGRDGNNERFEKVEYNRSNTYDPDRKPRVNFNNTERGYNSNQRPYNNRPNYNRQDYNSNYGNRSYNNDNNERGYNNNERGYNTQDRPYNRPRINQNQGNRYGNNQGGDRPYRPSNKPAYGNAQGGNRNYNPRPHNEGYQQRGYNNGGNRPFNKPQRRTGDYDPHAKYSLKKRIEYNENHIDPNEPIRLNKFLANAGICSRREADEFIQAGVVKVNGVVMNELGTKIHRNDAVLFHDQPVKLESKVYVLLNKPKDCVTTSDDPQGRLTVMDIVRSACTERIYPVGRLDRNTTGVMLLTNDGDLASKLTHPKFIKKKIYHVWTDKDVKEEDMQKIADGIELEDGPIHADAVSYATDTDKNQVGIEIHSGRNRIVRRMFEALGYRVIKLDRVYFAGLTKKNLPRGRWRYLTQQEVNILRMGAFE